MKLNLEQARRKQNCIGLAYWYKYLSANVSMYIRRSYGGLGLPQGKKIEFDAVRWLLRLFFGPKTPLLIFALVLA